MLHSYLNQILTSPVYDVAIESPLEKAPSLSKRLGVDFYLKREDLQPVFSFKLRGAYNRMASLTPEQRQLGVVTASAGNHAQGVALAAAKMGIEALVVMPKTTPSIKVRAVERLGGRVILHGLSYSESSEFARKMAHNEGKAFIHPYDDPLVIAGQGTVGLEILRQHPGPLHAIFVPVGGGGLIAGIAAFFKAVRPDVKIIGVEPDDSNCMTQALAAGERVVLPQVGLFADGVAVKQVGERTFEIARHYVDAMVNVSTDEICAAIKDVFDDTRSIAEPSGALAVAGAKVYAQKHALPPETCLVAVVSGANMNFDRLRYVAERAELGENREAVFAVTIPERPGSFKAFCEQLGERSITEFNYRYADAQHAHVFVGVELRGGESEKVHLMQALTSAGLSVVDLSQDEMAKLHIRYMVGGRAPGLQDERLYRFEFPEQPGALLAFLQGIGERWNISLFHYRNHGADYGRVLVGIQVDDADLACLTAYLEKSGYTFLDESDNPAYHLFLQ
jgi:threonine dehydratase